MAVHGINSGLFEFLLAPDKKTQEFLASLKPGDTLRGKVADIIQGQNKAVINFRGNNVTSLMPQGMDIQKGDIINVTVTKTGDSIFMKLSNNITAEVGRGAPVISAGTAAATPQQIAGMLAAAQAPVNEQNIYIAQKLIDYNLPVDSKNINDINSALVMNMRSKGIEQAVISLSGQDAAKEALASFLARLNTQMAAHASAMKAGASQAEAQSIRQEAAVKALNMLNVINSIAAQAGRAGITVSGQSVTLELLNVQPQLFNAIGAQMQTLENARGRAQNVPAPATQAGGAALNTGQTAANQAQVSLSTGVPAQTAAGMPAQTVAGVPAQTVAGAPAQTAAG
ncbi:MAG TPA: hypothetical protein ENN43_03560, partial [bacterium]|nr:hypothetical protein [bacterium]